jgi:hypothetical protein
VSVANAIRGEAEILIDGIAHVLRPTFEALARAEDELGALLGWIERAAGGEAKLVEVVALFWHCLAEGEGKPTRERLGEAIAQAGLAAATPILKALIAQILKGR